MKHKSTFKKVEIIAFLQNRQEEMEIENSVIHVKIDDWLNNNDSSLNSSNEKTQKRKELSDLGKFIYCFNYRFNQDIEIIEANCESPDFIISINNKTIGIELTDLIIKDSKKETEGKLRKIFNQVKIELKKESNDCNGSYTIYLAEDISFNKENLAIIKSEITSLILGKISSGNLVVKFRKSSNKKISIYHGVGWGVGPLNRITVENKINRKEVKIANYISERFKEIWLLLVIAGVSESDDYSFIADDVINSPFNTSFSRVFILNSYKSELFELKTSQ